MANVPTKGQIEFNVIIGQRIAAVMEEQNLTDEQLSKMIDENRVNITRYRNGQRQCPTVVLKRIAEACNVSVDFLFGLSLTMINNINFQKSCGKIKDSITTEEEQFLIIDGLREFMHGWCMDAEEKNKCKEPVFRCRNCPFEDGGFCCIKRFVKDLCGKEAAYSISAMSR